MVELALGAILLVSCVQTVILAFLLAEKRHTPGEPMTLTTAAATVRDALVDTLRTKRTVIVADDAHQARMERRAHQEGAPIQPPSRYR